MCWPERSTLKSYGGHLPVQMGQEGLAAIETFLPESMKEHTASHPRKPIGFGEGRWELRSLEELAQLKERCTVNSR